MEPTRRLVIARGSFAAVSRTEDEDNQFAQNRLYVKTIVAVPGDTISISDGRIIVNGIQSNLTVGATDRWGPRQVGDQLYFVAGDPRDIDRDSRGWGLVQAASILGTVRPRQ